MLACGVRLSDQKGDWWRIRFADCRSIRRSIFSPSEPQKGAGIIKKVLESAIANAEHNDGADIDELKVKTIYVEKAWCSSALPRAQRGVVIGSSKPTCHIF